MTSSDSSSDGEDGPDDYCVKIFYCSRTHSQLSQFLHEIKKSPYSSNLKVTILGSRANLCVNSDINVLKSNAVMNERCLELRQSKAHRVKKQNENKNQKLCTTQTPEGGASEKNERTAISRCPYYSVQRVRDFSSYVCSEIRDMENLVSQGREAMACPYYGTRQAVTEAEVVLLPYNMLLHKEQRKALNVQLAENIVIIDEAHNLVETINEVHSITLRKKEIHTTYRKLAMYLRAVKARLKPINLLYTKQILHCVQLLHKVFDIVHPDSSQPGSHLFTIMEFQQKADLADINLFNLIKYIRESHLSSKIQGYELSPQQASSEVKIHYRFVILHFICLGDIPSLCDLELSIKHCTDSITNQMLLYISAILHLFL